MHKIFSTFLLSICVSVTLAQPADFDRFTKELSQQLETDALDVTALGMKHDFAMQLCARVGGASARNLKDEVVEWQKRNATYLKASINVVNAIGERYFLAGGESARQSYLRKIWMQAGKDANDQVVRKLNGASLDNSVVPLESGCTELATYLRDRAFEIEGMRSITRALRPYVQRANEPAPVPLDVVDRAVQATFQSYSRFLCLGKTLTVKEIREQLTPYIKGIDASKQESYGAIVTSVFTAFPCPFSPLREELRPAIRADMVGTWLVPDASGKLRYRPDSPAWKEPAGVPPIRCEGIAMHDSGEYRVMQIRGKMDCPDGEKMQKMRAMPQVQSWNVMSNGRVRISRTDVPASFEEWEMFRVQKDFAFFGIQFSVGDLVAYMRGEPGNEANIATTFRHLQALRD